ncbi:MAG: DnaJ domain-containing protein [Bdellovibrionales bacterium]|nr:DnaJ domain-containing protein [Bdellovibrionales bacterium]
MFGWFGRLDDLAVIGYLLYRSSKRFERSSKAEDSGSADDASNGRNAKAAHEQKAVDPYSTLGVERSASAEQIREAYRKQAAQYHPDKVNHLGPELQKVAHAKMLEIQSAYETLMKRGAV